MYYNDVQGVLVCFDLTDEESFQRLNFWLQDLARHAPENVVRILVGLKYDLVARADMAESRDSEYDGMEMMQMRSRETLTAAMNRKVSTEEALKFA